MAEMVGPAWMRLTGESDQNRQINWSIVTEWAELLFVSWATARLPRHPRLLDGNR